MSTLFATVAKISKLEQIAREQAASSSSDSSTSSLGKDTTLSFLEDQIQKKFFSTTDFCFHVKLMQGIQKYELILNPMSPF